MRHPADRGRMPLVFCVMESYFILTKRVSAEIEEKKSRFIASLAPVSNEEEALLFLDEIRSTHRMARHNVYAYILAADDRIRYSDDGEPSKTAGLPVLEVLKGAQVKNVACVVTRYFGGTLLGTGGLVRAYSLAVKTALEQAELAQMIRCVDFYVELTYDMFASFKALNKIHRVNMLSTDYTDKVNCVVRLRAEQKESYERALMDLLHGSQVFSFSAPLMAPFMEETK